MRSGAPLTLAITVVTVLAWLFAIVSGYAPMLSVEGGFIPARVAGSTGFAVPIWLTPLTATLIHGGIVHLGFNMLMFVYIGREVERVLGTVPLAFIYVTGAYAAAAGQHLVEPVSRVPMIGASGAISAVLAAYALLFGRNAVKRIGPIPAHWVRGLWLLAAWIGVQWLIGIATRGSGGPMVATAAHIGGFVAGLVLARPMLSWRYREA